MSNFLSVATVTETLRQLLYSSVKDDVPGATATTISPGDTNNVPSIGVNIFLFHISGNTALKNAGLPTRRGDGTSIKKPRAAINLQYLLSFYGNESELEPQRCLGCAIRAMTTQPLLTRQNIKDAISTVSYLAGSDLANEIDLVRFNPIPISTEELSSLWYSFFQVPYNLSIAYEASVVFIDGEAKPLVLVPLPVLSRGIYVKSFNAPIIKDVISNEGANVQIFFGSTILIRGTNLLGDITRVIIGDLELEPSDVSPNVVELVLDDSGLRSGVLGLYIAHKILMGDPAVAHIGPTSNASPFILRPVISNIAYNGSASPPEISMDVSPVVGSDQTVSLILNRTTSDSPTSYIFDGPELSSDVSSLTFQVEDITAGTYLVRIQVDGVESVLETNSEGVYDQPSLEVT